jgi:hypothetical protein
MNSNIKDSFVVRKAVRVSVAKSLSPLINDVAKSIRTADSYVFGISNDDVWRRAFNTVNTSIETLIIATLNEYGF